MPAFPRRPPLSFYSRKPVVILPRAHRRKRKSIDAEKGTTGTSESEDEDALDQHVEDVLTKRAKFRRIMQGVWSFTKTRTCRSNYHSIAMLNMFAIQHLA